MIILGTMTWGRETPYSEAAKIYDYARTAGIDTFDTAAIYGDGKAEEWLGRFSKGDGVKVNTKVGYNGEDVYEQAQQSRQRIGRDINIIFHHHWDKHGRFKHIGALDRCRMLATYVGLSNCAAWQAALVSREIPIRALQFLYNLVKRTAEIELIPFGKMMAIELQGYSPLASGLLTGKYSAEDQCSDWRLNSDSRYRERYREALADINPTKIGAGSSLLPRAAVQWVKNQGVRPILGARTVRQLAEALTPINEVPEAIEHLFPAPPLATDRSEEQ